MTLMPLLRALAITLLSTLELKGTITSASTPSAIRFSSCAIWRASLALADCTLTLAPRAVAACTK